MKVNTFFFVYKCLGNGSVFGRAQSHLARLVLLGDADYDVALDIVGAGDLDVELRVHRRSL